MKWSEFSHDPLAPIAITLSIASIGGIFLSTLIIIAGLLGTLFVYLYPGRACLPPAPEEIPYIPPTITNTPTITPTYIPPTFMGPQKVQPVGIFTSTPTPSPTPVTTIEFIYLTTPIGPGSRATLTVKTMPAQQCHITYITPLGNISEAQDLITITSDSSGICSWTWNIGIKTEPGTGSITVQVGEVTATYSIEITDD